MRTSRVCAPGVWPAVHHGSCGVQLRLRAARSDGNVLYSCCFCRTRLAAGALGSTLLLQMWPLLAADSPAVSGLPGGVQQPLMFSFRLCSHTVWGIRVLVDYRKVLTQVCAHVHALTTAVQHSECYWDLAKTPVLPGSFCLRS